MQFITAVSFVAANSNRCCQRSLTNAVAAGNLYAAVSVLSAENRTRLSWKVRRGKLPTSLSSAP